MTNKFKYKISEHLKQIKKHHIEDEKSHIAFHKKLEELYEENDEFKKYTKEYLADLKAWKNIEEGTILLRFKFADVIGGHFLVRFFDRNGNYLSHLVSREMREIYGNPTDFDSKASQVIYADFEFGNVIIKTRDPDGFKYLTERVLVYPVNIRDLRDTEIICLSLAD